MALDTATSIAQGLAINQADTLTSIRVEYMECDSVAFVVGDRVVVEFTGQLWESEIKVIGFETNPKPCGPWPAFEAYDSDSHDANFIGVVLCMGGGFEPPYRFVAKDSLPEDYPDESAGPLPDERIWDGYEDVEPLGIVEPGLSVSEQPTVSLTGSVIYDIESKQVGEMGYACIATSANRDVNLTIVYKVGYKLDGEEHPGYWEDITYQCFDNTYSKPYHTLDLEETQENVLTEYGGAQQYVWDYSTIDGVGAAIAYCQGQAPGGDGKEWWGALVNVFGGAGSFPCGGWCDYECMLPNSRSTYFREYFSSYNYTRDQESTGIDRYYGSILNGSEFSLVYNKGTTLYRNHYYGGYLDRNHDYYSVQQGYGPAYMALDGEIMEITPHDASKQRIGWCRGAKYFQVDNLHIGLSFFGLGSTPLDYYFGYAQVDQETGESKLVTTYMGDSLRGLIPGVTDDDGNPVYYNGYNNYRMIK